MQAQAATQAGNREVKCLVWDLDNTLWDGILLESGNVRLRPDAVKVIRTLDQRGILHSVASRNDYGQAMQQLTRFGLAEYFLYPQIHWDSKVASLKHIARALNIGIDTLALVDDQPFERDEVKHSLPEVLCLDAGDLAEIPQRKEMQPAYITEDSRLRRQMYVTDQLRQSEEEGFSGTKEEFLATLNMCFSIAYATEEDLRRAEELTVRTHQMNTTGVAYSYAQLKEFVQSDRHLLLIAGLEDKYGSYGKIGLALLEAPSDVWTIKLFLMSCRVVARGVGTVFLNYILSEALGQKRRLQAELVPNDRNRMMFLTYKLAGFKQVGLRGTTQILETDFHSIQKFPSYMQVITPGKPH